LAEPSTITGLLPANTIRYMVARHKNGATRG
jgi:hypothetical protein